MVEGLSGRCKARLISYTEGEPRGSYLLPHPTPSPPARMLTERRRNYHRNITNEKSSSDHFRGVLLTWGFRATHKAAGYHFLPNLSVWGVSINLRQHVNNLPSTPVLWRGPCLPPGLLSWNPSHIHCGYGKTLTSSLKQLASVSSCFDRHTTRIILNQEIHIITRHRDCSQEETYLSLSLSLNQARNPRAPI